MVAYLPFVRAIQLNREIQRRWAFSDFDRVYLAAARYRVDRGLDTGGSATEKTGPCARVRFITDAPAFNVVVYYNALYAVVAAPGATAGAVLVDGALHSRFDTDAAIGVAREITVPLAFAGRAERLIEVLLPYGAGCDFTGLTGILEGDVLRPPPPRPPLRAVLFGDSVTQGYATSSIDRTWAYQLGVLKNWTIVNQGFAGRTLIAADGLPVGRLNGDRVIVAMGLNSAGLGAAAKAPYKLLLQNIRAGQPVVKIYVLTLTWTTVAGAADFRQAQRDAVAELADPNITLIEGLSLATNSTAAFPDGVHPNDLGAAQIAAALAAAVS